MHVPFAAAHLRESAMHAQLEHFRDTRRRATIAHTTARHPPKVRAGLSHVAHWGWLSTLFRADCRAIHG
jgi:hypothetical protein